MRRKMMFFDEAIEFHGAEAVFFGIILFYAFMVAIALALAGIADMIWGA